MRVEPAPPATFGELDPLTRLRQYVSAVRRRWYLVVVLALLGGGLAWYTTPQTATVKVDDEKGEVVAAGPAYFRASHVLIQEQSSTDGSTSVNLTQAAYLVNTGEVPGRVAEDLGLTRVEVESSLLGLPLTNVSSIEVQAIGTDPQLAVELADSAAAQLIVVLAAQAQAEADGYRDRVIARLDELDVQIDQLTMQIAANPPNRTQLEAQQRSLSNQYSQVYEQFSQLANQAPASAGLTSLEGARAEQISKAAFDNIRTTIRDGADYVTGATPSADTEVEVEPPAPGEPASRTTRGIAGFIVGLLAGIGLALLLDRFDSRLRRRDDVEAVTGISVLAELPPLKRKEQQHQEVVAHTQHRSRAAEAYRVVRGAVMFAEQADQDGSSPAIDREGAVVIMVTSANPAEGKTTVTANLAAVLAEGGLDVLVVNCDFRRPRVHKYLIPDLEPSPDGKRVPVLADTQIERVRLISGIGENDPEANPLDVVAMQRKVIQMARPRFDVILLDTAPFLTTNDASELLSETDHLILVVRGGKTSREAAGRTAEILGRLDAPVLGIVLNDSHETPVAQYYYGYESDGSGRGRSLRATDSAERGGSRETSTRSDVQRIAR